MFGTNGSGNTNVNGGFGSGSAYRSVLLVVGVHTGMFCLVVGMHPGTACLALMVVGAQT